MEASEQNEPARTQTGVHCFQRWVPCCLHLSCQERLLSMTAAQWLLVPSLPELAPIEILSTSFCLKRFRQQHRPKMGERQGCYPCSTDRELGQRESKSCLQAGIAAGAYISSDPHGALTIRLAIPSFFNPYSYKKTETQTP